MTAKWLVTGANGYLGGALCLGLHENGHPVCALARSGRSLDHLEAVGIPCRSYEELPDVIGEGDILLHCAGKVCATGRWEDYEQINVNWSVEIFEQAKLRRAACYIYISSVAALGYSNRDQDAALDEEAEPILLEGEMYGRSKLAAERRLAECAHGTSTRLVILRPGLVYGRRPMTVPKGWLRRGNVVDEGQRVPLVHVDSVLSAAMAGGESPGMTGTFFVVDEEQPTLRTLNTLKLELGLLRRRPWPLGRFGFRLVCLLRIALWRVRGLGAPPRGYFEAQYAMQTRRLVYSTRRLRKAVNWLPAVTLEAGLRDCAAFACSGQPDEE